MKAVKRWIKRIYILAFGGLFVVALLGGEWPVAIVALIALIPIIAIEFKRGYRGEYADAALTNETHAKD